MREIYNDEMLDLENFLDLFLNPEKYGCRFEKGSPKTYKKRAGHIVDAARNCIEQLRERTDGINRGDS